MSRFLALCLVTLLLAHTQPQSALAVEENLPPQPAAEATAEPGATSTTEAVGDIQNDSGPVTGIDEMEIDQRPPMVDRTHERISSGVLGMARWLDEFFADPRVEAEESKSRIKVRFSLFAEEGEAIDYDVRAGIRLDLPILEERLQLLIAGDPEDDDDFRAITGSEGAPPELADDDENFSVALRYFLKRTAKRNVSLRSGIRFRDGLPHLYLEPRYRQSVPMDRWLFRFTQRVIGITDGTVRARTIFDFERGLKPDLFFRATAEGTWDKDEHGYAYSLGPSIYHRLSARRVIVYGWSNAFVTHPSHRLEAVALSVRYRQRIYRDWLYYEVIPQLSFPREENFDVTPGIEFRLEMVFGHYRKLPPEPEMLQPVTH